MHERRFHREIERLRDPERITRLEVERVVELSLEGLLTPHAVLDIGTGSAIFAERFASRGLAVSGIDANPEMLTVAQGFVPEGVFKEAIAEAIPFNDHEFDLALMGLVLHETDDPLKALQEAYRVTTDRVAVLEWRYEEGTFGPPLSDRISGERIVSLAKQAGFQTTQVIKLENLMLYRLDH